MSTETLTDQLLSYISNNDHVAFEQGLNAIREEMLRNLCDESIVSYQENLQLLFTSFSQVNDYLQAEYLKSKPKWYHVGKKRTVKKTQSLIIKKMINELGKHLSILDLNLFHTLPLVGVNPWR